MKKLKLNKQTIALLGNDWKKKIIGGENAPTQFPCEVEPQSNARICTDFPTNNHFNTCNGNATCFNTKSLDGETFYDYCCTKC